MPASAVVSDRARWVSLAGICTAAGLVWLAFADLGVALPTIADDFGADLSQLQWANNAFSLVTGALVIAAGKLADVHGRRRLLLIGVAMFGVFSVVSAVAPDVGTLVVGRGLMGLGAAAILPATLALIPPQFTGAARLTAFGAWQAVAWGGQAVGPAIGGVVTSGLGWRWLFWINIPLALVAYLLVRSRTPESADSDASPRTDWAGLVTIAAAVFALLFALTEGPSMGWGSAVVVLCLVAAVVLAVAWFVIERRVREPLVDLAIFRLRAYDGALVANLTMNLAFAGLSFVLVLWLQNVRGFDPVQAGLLMLPATVGIFALIPLGGRMDARRGGRPPVLVGLVVMALGVTLLATLGRATSLWPMVVGLLVVGLGLGLLSTPISNTAVGEVPERLVGSAAGLFKMSSMVGGALGVAVLSALMRGFTVHHSQDELAAAHLTDQQVDDVHASLVNSTSFADALQGVPENVARAITDAVEGAFSFGVARSMLVTAVLSLLATGVVLLMWPRRAHVSEGPGAD